MVAQELYAVTCRAAAAVDPALTIEGMISSEDGPNRTAILITVAGCHAHPCTIALTVDRSRNPSRQLVNKLVAALATHALDRGRSARF